MATRVIRRAEDVDKLANFVAAHTTFPLLVTITKGDARSNQQNRLAQRWFTDVARQNGESHEDVRAYCKLRFGVPLLRAENEAFRASYDRAMGHLTYEDKLEAIKAFDLPVTRLMTVKQMTAFMDEVQRHFLSNGFHLTDPEAVRYEEEFA